MTRPRIVATIISLAPFFGPPLVIKRRNCIYKNIILLSMRMYVWFIYLANRHVSPWKRDVGNYVHTLFAPLDGSSCYDSNTVSFYYCFHCDTVYFVYSNSFIALDTPLTHKLLSSTYIDQFCLHTRLTPRDNKQQLLWVLSLRLFRNVRGADLDILGLCSIDDLSLLLSGARILTFKLATTSEMKNITPSRLKLSRAVKRAFHYVTRLA